MKKKPTIPRKGTRQHKVLKALVCEAEGWKSYILDLPGVSHRDLVSDIVRLRKKGWPIEDEAVDEGSHRSRHGYRLDPERWRTIKKRVEI